MVNLVLNIAACGHPVRVAQSYVVKDKSKDGKNVLKYMTLCADCLKEYVKADMIAQDRIDEQQWLGLESYHAD